VMSWDMNLDWFILINVVESSSLSVM